MIIFFFLNIEFDSAISDDDALPDKDHNYIIFRIFYRRTRRYDTKNI